jgi:peptidoglycan hydrolase-like protein with peptidoglycan-binding domain
MKTGDTGTEVASLQKALTTLGVATLTADGNYGPATAQAVTAFQEQHGLTADGVAGPATVDAINQALAAQG